MFRKYHYLSFLIFSFSLLTIRSGFAQSKMLSKGDAAPVFAARASLAGRQVFRYYPSRVTPAATPPGSCGCTGHLGAKCYDPSGVKEVGALHRGPRRGPSM